MIVKYSANPGLDVVNFFEVVLFSFLTGNADMHLKNFSLIRQPGTGMILLAAYDLVATALGNPGDDEDLALTLNGKKKKIKEEDFVAAFTAAKLDGKQQENIFAKMQSCRFGWMQEIESIFLDKGFKAKYQSLLNDRFDRLMK